MTIGNVSLKIRQMPSTHSIGMVALLPNPIKNNTIPQKRLDEQRKPDREVLNEALQLLLLPRNFKWNPRAGRGYYNVVCADGNCRHRKLVLAAWLADCLEYSDLYHLEQHVYFWCGCPKNKVEDDLRPDKQHPWRDHNLYKTLSNGNTKAADAKLPSRHVHREFNVFWHIPCILSDLIKPKLLHTIWFGMLDHLQKWIFHFVKTYK